MLAVLLSPTSLMAANEGSVSIPINVSFGSYCEVINAPSSVDFVTSSSGALTHDFTLTWRCTGANDEQLGISFLPIPLPNGGEVLITRPDNQQPVTPSSPALFDFESGIDMTSRFTATILESDARAIASERNWSGVITGVLQLN